MSRKAKVERKTKETKISVEINLDGKGECTVDYEDEFFQHMINTLAKYSGFDIAVKASGDDEHHIIEDIAITMANAFVKALGDKPINRMATKTVVMDDALVMSSLDIIDRPFVDIDCPDPMYTHFLRSFALTAGITLHIMIIRGFDEHHAIEAAFKSLGFCLGEAVVPRKTAISTKSNVELK